MTRGERNCSFIESFCRVPEGKLVGKPLVLDPFERKFIIDVYDNPHGTRKAILSIARKNGKSCIIACIVILHVAGPEAVLNSQIGSGALSRDQAALVYGLASKMINLNPKLKAVCRTIPSKKTIIGVNRNVEYKALSAESSTAHGLSLVIAILDEIGQIRGPQDDFIDAIITCQGAHDNPMLIVISTQAPTDGDLLSIWIDDAIASKDPHTVCHLYEAPKDCDLMDEEAWAAANPALGTFRSVEDVRQMAEQASRLPSMENTFRNLFLNQRVAITSPFISKAVWEQNGEEPEELAGDIWVALDLSAKKDLTAMIAICRRGEWWDVHCWFFAPEKGLRERTKRDRVPYDVWKKQGFLTTTPGATVDYSFVAAEIQKNFTNVKLRGIIFDRWRIDLLKLELDKIGFITDGAPDEEGKPTSLLIPHGQGYKDMSPSIDSIEGELLNGRVKHGMNPILTMCAANAVTISDAAGNRKLEKSKSTGRIDGLVALTMAIGRAVGTGEYREIKSIYESKGVLAL